MRPPKEKTILSCLPGGDLGIFPTMSPSPESVLIATRNLTKSFPDANALDSLTMRLQRGEVVGLLGPNGAGKTTALHILLGLLSPTSGGVTVFGLSPIRDRAKISKRINFSSAYVQLPSNLKVRENLKIFSMIYNVPNPARKIDFLLELFEIGHLKNRLTGALSSGEKTRLNLCKALLNDPELLLLDEPTASLDPEVAERVRLILKKIQKERAMGIIYTSHNMAEVEQICDRILFLHRGKTITEGTPADIMRHFNSRSLEQVFIKIVRGGDVICE